ncbi:AraC family transcriptional regulator [Flammeovirga sp. MY04]|uniref:AraC family transcriptional regulator n=1 Tax=Flammeovirga sp. MY04 TaxID=1191459 RepID=UPI000806204F|nr:AraC family transcriptional regulator [Flammeovirga sp. MY04]ANQ49197.1 AraC family transcriptional regulator [Flammeovirga sp. MY04]
MKKYLLFEDINYLEIDKEAWDHPVHNHDHYEWIIVLKGNGIHQINGVNYDYNPGDIFFLRPNDAHFFTFHSPSQLVYFQFSIDLSVFENELVLKKKMLSILQIHKEENVGNLKSVFNNDSLMLHQIQWASEVIKTGDISKDFLRYQLFTFLSFIKKNNSEGSSLHEEMDDIIIYIRSNIKEVKRLSVVHLAAQFNKSSTYFGEYFKKNMGISIKKYIDRLRSNYLEKELIFSSKSLSELAYEYQFTDLSHFNKFVNQHLHKTPLKIRKDRDHV